MGDKGKGNKSGPDKKPKTEKKAGNRPHEQREREAGRKASA
jgi:hypothetical protein